MASMINRFRKVDLVQIFNSLSEIPLTCKDEPEALRRIAELGRRALRSQACTLTFVDLENKYLIQAASAGFDNSFEEYLVGKKTKLGSRTNGDTLDFELIAKGKVVELYGLQRDGQGVANTRVAQQYNLSAVLGYPLISEDRLIGYFNHFSSSGAFSTEEKRIIEIFARQAVITIERLEYYSTLPRAMVSLNELTRGSTSPSSNEFMQQVAERAREFLAAPACIAWRLDEEAQKLKIVASSGLVNDEVKKIELSIAEPGIKKHLSRRKVAYISDVTQPHPNYLHANKAKEQKWISLLSAPMWAGDRLIGMLDIYTEHLRYFRDWQKDFFEVYANYVAEIIANKSTRARLILLNEIIREMTETLAVGNLLELILGRIGELVSCGYAAVGKLDFRTGSLKLWERSGEASSSRTIDPREGIIGYTLLNGKPTRVNDISHKEDEFVGNLLSKGSRSALAVPIVLSNAKIRVGRDIPSGSKPLGILCIESPAARSFSQADEEVLWLLARQAAVIIDRLETDIKNSALRQIERDIGGKRDWNDIINIVLDGITNTLGFSFVNISLVIPELDRIKSKYVRGIPEDKADEFMTLADHSLDSNDIQATIVKSREIEVLDSKDARLDQIIFRKFHHDELIRVFMPMIGADNRVMGTVEAAYQKNLRSFIYEQDIQILKGFVDYAVRALELRSRGLLDRITHELTAPIVGIRNNTVKLERRRTHLSEERIEKKLKDILLDSEILLLQVGELEYMLGKTQQAAGKVEETIVVRDIIVKTINQLAPLVEAQGLDPLNVEYNPADIRRIKISINRAKLNQVVNNLLLNSIKYAEIDKRLFSIKIAIDETRDDFVIKFKDWGIGIGQGYEEKIFEEGFRTPEAKAKDVNGSGLGLTIARKTMREFGGDLRLANNHTPTEFHVILPKSPKEAAVDTVH